MMYIGYFLILAGMCCFYMGVQRELDTKLTIQKDQKLVATDFVFGPTFNIVDDDGKELPKKYKILCLEETKKEDS